MNKHTEVPCEQRLKKQARVPAGSCLKTRECAGYSSNATEGPLHIRVVGVDGTEGFVICEQIKLIDPSVRSCRRIDRLSYGNLMNISDALQGVFEYD